MGADGLDRFARTRGVERGIAKAAVLDAMYGATTREPAGPRRVHLGGSSGSDVGRSVDRGGSRPCGVGGRGPGPLCPRRGHPGRSSGALQGLSDHRPPSGSGTRRRDRAVSPRRVACARAHRPHRRGRGDGRDYRAGARALRGHHARRAVRGGRQCGRPLLGSEVIGTRSPTSCHSRSGARCSLRFDRRWGWVRMRTPRQRYLR